VAELADQIEAFLRNALAAKRVEDQQVRAALRELRPVLNAAENLVRNSGVLAIGPNREAIVQQVVQAVAGNVQQVWGIPLLSDMQTTLAGYVNGQLEFARKMVELSGGTLTQPGAAASLNVAQVVNQAIVGGKPLATQLTQTLPAIVADRVERYIRLGLSSAGGDVFATYKDAVVTITERNVEATIRTGVHEIGSAAQQAIYEFETDPAWMNIHGLVWTAVLDSDVCPVCLALDGRRYKLGEPGRYFDGRNKVSPHHQCRCYLLPYTWRTEQMTNPETGETTLPQRPAEGDNGEDVIGFKASVKDWVKANPETTQAIFGKKLGTALVDGKIGFDKAVKQWSGKR
jgi:hypothetical protein